MGQLFLVILVISAAFGIYRCNGAGTADTQGKAPDPDASLQTPARVEKALQDQVDQINRRNRDTLDRY